MQEDKIKQIKIKRVANFEKVSLHQFIADWIKTFGNRGNHIITEIYNNINLPTRATFGSAGHDFFSPFDFTLEPGETIKIPTGIRCKIKEGWVLKVYPRSSLGFKYRLGLDNTVGIIDSDYYNSDNEGHIFLKMTNDTKGDKAIHVKVGEGIAQGIFVEYGITVDDDVTEVRNGGFGSTNKK